MQRSRQEEQVAAAGLRRVLHPSRLDRAQLPPRRRRRRGGPCLGLAAHVQVRRAPRDPADGTPEYPSASWYPVSTPQYANPPTVTSSKDGRCSPPDPTNDFPTEK